MIYTDELEPINADLKTIVEMVRDRKGLTVIGIARAHDDPKKFEIRVARTDVLKSGKAMDASDFYVAKTAFVSYKQMIGWALSATVEAWKFLNGEPHSEPDAKTAASLLERAKDAAVREAN